MSETARYQLRRFAALLVGIGTAFWVYTFYWITHLPMGDGTGLQWLAAVPLAMIFAGFFIPAAFLVAINRLLRFAAIWGVAGLIAFGIVFVQLLGETHH